MPEENKRRKKKEEGEKIFGKIRPENGKVLNPATIERFSGEHF